MKLEYDEQKSLRNEQERGLPFSVAQNFEFDTAFIEQDIRFEYSKPRFKVIGFIHERLFVIVFCLRNENYRIISLRKANPREVKKYEIYRRLY
ncbi:hypothetical protein ASU3_10490 [Actinobacillus suis]|uniref:BrnT family toxin n=1 Tax=Actinobacillus suis TaxID=716 RepID=UPI0009DA2A36|nr:BrnT family toxin [Actinobacillus suis]OQS56219.1 hypothetical protein ASU3_10490 [Actinobacillus suis]